MARETWYVLEDGNVVDPGECTADDKGCLTHESGVKVAMRFADCPMSRGVDADVERAKADPAAGQAEADAKGKGKGKAVKADDKGPGYTTRESKAD